MLIFLHKKSHSTNTSECRLARIFLWLNLTSISVGLGAIRQESQNVDLSASHHISRDFGDGFSRRCYGVKCQTSVIL